eukprot:GFYU01011168.1.p3 GENE.GFYU01011168.1~~GFYU01011168.1.p3  ORF type:complete len:105 (+),score=26.56 GFYU01011168.1:66-380(+)
MRLQLRKEMKTMHDSANAEIISLGVAKQRAQERWQQLMTLERDISRMRGGHDDDDRDTSKHKATVPERVVDDSQSESKSDSKDKGEGEGEGLSGVGEGVSRCAS